MAHDVKGRTLKVGDKVNVPCTVETINNEGVALRTSHLVPGETQATKISLHSAQTKKSEAKG
jgi:hypothetical protein